MHQRKKRSLCGRLGQRAPGYEKLALVKPEVWISEMDAKRDNSPGESEGSSTDHQVPPCPFRLFSTTRQTCNIFGPFAIREVFSGTIQSATKLQIPFRRRGNMEE